MPKIYSRLVIIVLAWTGLFLSCGTRLDRGSRLSNGKRIATTPYEFKWAFSNTNARFKLTGKSGDTLEIKTFNTRGTLKPRTGAITGIERDKEISLIESSSIVQFKLTFKLVNKGIASPSLCLSPERTDKYFSADEHQQTANCASFETACSPGKLVNDNKTCECPNKDTTTISLDTFLSKEQLDAPLCGSEGGFNYTNVANECKTSKGNLSQELVAVEAIDAGPTTICKCLGQQLKLEDYKTAGSLTTACTNGANGTASQDQLLQYLANACENVLRASVNLSGTNQLLSPDSECVCGENNRFKFDEYLPKGEEHGILNLIQNCAGALGDENGARNPNSLKDNMNYKLKLWPLASQRQEPSSPNTLDFPTFRQWCLEVPGMPDDQTKDRCNCGGGRITLAEAQSMGRDGFLKSCKEKSPTSTPQNATDRLAWFRNACDSTEVGGSTGSKDDPDGAYCMCTIYVHIGELTNYNTESEILSALKQKCI